MQWIRESKNHKPSEYIEKNSKCCGIICDCDVCEYGNRSWKGATEPQRIFILLAESQTFNCKWIYFNLIRYIYVLTFVISKHL